MLPRDDQKQASPNRRQVKIGRQIPAGHDALQLTHRVVVDQQKIPPHVRSACLSFGEHDLVPERTVADPVQPGGVEKCDEHHYWYESDEATDDRNRPNSEIIHFRGLCRAGIQASEKNNCVQEAAEREEDLHDCASVNLPMLKRQTFISAQSLLSFFSRSRSSKSPESAAPC